MASIKVATLRIVKNELCTLQETVPLWEVPLLEALHGTVETLSQSVQSGRDAPEAADEYTRLENRYQRTRNEDGSFGIPTVAAVYGQHGAGISMLKRAIAEATVGEDSLV